MIDIASFKQIFGEAFDSDILSKIISVLHQYYELVTHYSQSAVFNNWPNYHFAVMPMPTQYWNVWEMSRGSPWMSNSFPWLITKVSIYQNGSTLINWWHDVFNYIFIVELEEIFEKLSKIRPDGDIELLRSLYK